MTVKLIYFKPSGKYYADGHYETAKADLGDIWDEVRGLNRDGDLPGLAPGSKDWVVSVSVPNHLNDHPRLIMPGPPFPPYERI